MDRYKPDWNRPPPGREGAGTWTLGLNPADHCSEFGSFEVKRFTEKNEMMEKIRDSVCQ